VVQVRAELLCTDPAVLLRWVSARHDSYSLVIDARRGQKLPSQALSLELVRALRRCVRVAVCVGPSALHLAPWHHTAGVHRELERRVLVDLQLAVRWAREPHVRLPMRARAVTLRKHEPGER
jgi:hypothetical protein